MGNEIQDANPLIKLRTLYQSLRVSEQKVADYIDIHPEEVIYLSISALADKCGVSEASVIRLCKVLGYDGYQELKINMARSLVAPVKYIHEEIEEDDDTDKIIQKVMVADMKAIEDTLKILDRKEVERAVNAISKARKLEFYGLGGSAPVAFDAQHKFLRHGIPCIAYNDSHMQIMSASMLGKGDVVVGISHSGSTKDIVDSLNIAAKAGAETICITSSEKSPVTKASSVKLIISARELSYRPEPMASRIAQLSVIDVLSVGVAIKREREVINNLEKSREALIAKRY
ncbi:MAG: transcriptional regulator [Clostridia bacterium]|jgi:DNA-binding MurR/RpiR family transcriptional regulator|nr:transcriptional regulator [Clostridia bacterium]